MAAKTGAENLGGNGWRLVYDKKRDMEGLLGIDGLKLEGKERDPPIKVHQAETVLTVEEMMDLIEDKLQLKAKNPPRKSCSRFIFPTFQV